MRSCIACTHLVCCYVLTVFCALGIEIINNLSYGGLQPELRVHVHNVSYGSLQPELQVRFNIDNVSYGSINLISNSDPVTHIVIIITTFQQNYINNVSYGSIFKDIMCL